MSCFPFTLIDLTHKLSPTIPTWDGSCGFESITVSDYGHSTTQLSFKVQQMNMHAGIGTHMDAPAHCIPHGKSIEAISLNECCAPCVIIDVSTVADAQFMLSKKYINDFEQSHGQIKEGTFVIVRTGWEKYWSTPKQYRNELQFPSVSIEAALQLLERNIAGLGIDTLSPDLPQSGYPVHQSVLSAGKYLVENVANLANMPIVGGYTLALPIPVQGGTEAPIRLVGLVAQGS